MNHPKRSVSAVDILKKSPRHHATIKQAPTYHAFVEKNSHFTGALFLVGSICSLPLVLKSLLIKLPAVIVGAKMDDALLVITNNPDDQVLGEMLRYSSEGFEERAKLLDQLYCVGTICSRETVELQGYAENGMNPDVAVFAVNSMLAVNLANPAQRKIAKPYIKVPWEEHIKETENQIKRDQKAHEKREKEMKEDEQRKLEAERKEKERLDKEERDRVEREKKDQERRDKEERDRVERERKDLEKKEKEERERVERERKDLEKKEKEERERIERERRDQEKREKDERERQERERLRQEKEEKERLELEKREGIYLFAYGTMMNDARLLEALKLTYLRKFPARKKSWALVFNGVSSANRDEGLANITPSATSVVYGIAYLIPSAKMLSMVDAAHGTDYRREALSLPIEIMDSTFTKVEKSATAEVYICKSIKTGLKPSVQQMIMMYEGKDYLPPPYYQHLTKISTM
eukprot:TRINITY_DN470_c0_g1_i2.p2 TRINITY_DN470_c0_g1~~TRINITY_DN470_c0_g1_i2.p2  ORF type:complete len:494 (-),score=223.92 TRINITY_DN470_c0_g1_i2:91-1485(-)